MIICGGGRGGRSLVIALFDRYNLTSTSSYSIYIKNFFLLNVSLFKFSGLSSFQKSMIPYKPIITLFFTNNSFLPSTPPRSLLAFLSPLVGTSLLSQFSNIPLHLPISALCCYTRLERLENFPELCEMIGPSSSVSLSK